MSGAPEPFAEVALSGWGRFPVETCRLFRPETRRGVERILAAGAETSYAPRGLGRSYGDAALNAGGAVISHERLDRFLAFDTEKGVLECEGGTSLAAILEVFLPRGYFLPVTPGTKFVTVGGAIASDVHGKNHHRSGPFSRYVVDVKLRTAEGEILLCSPTKNPEAFWATVGGMGLTGFIVSARLRLRRVETAWVLADFVKTRSLEETFARLGETDLRYEYSVAWLDALAAGKEAGRAILMQANPAGQDDVPGGLDPLRPPPRRGVRLPVDLPGGLLNAASVGAFNALFHRLHRSGVRQPMDVEKYFFPLDAIGGWNRMYGRRGFVQYQVVLPPEASGRGVPELLARIRASGRGAFLGVLKRFGEASPGLLSFPFPGWTLALDLPVTDGLVAFLRELDRVTLAHGGRIYAAKDAAATAETFAAMYPRLEAFRSARARLDPRGRLSSSLGRRLGIVPS